MDTPTTTRWKHLEPRPKSAYRQLFIKGTRIRARVIYGLFLCEEDPMTAEEIAEDYDLPLEAVREAIAYCDSNPPEIAEDYRREEANIQARATTSAARLQTAQGLVKWSSSASSSLDFGVNVSPTRKRGRSTQGVPGSSLANASGFQVASQPPNQGLKGH